MEEYTIHIFNTLSFCQAYSLMPLSRMQDRMEELDMVIMDETEPVEEHYVTEDDLAG